MTLRRPWGLPIFPRRVVAQGLAKCGRFLGGTGLFANRGVAQLHVEFDHDQAAEKKPQGQSSTLIEVNLQWV